MTAKQLNDAEANVNAARIMLEKNAFANHTELIRTLVNDLSLCLEEINKLNRDISWRDYPESMGR